MPGAGAAASSLRAGTCKRTVAYIGTFLAVPAVPAWRRLDSARLVYACRR